MSEIGIEVSGRIGQRTPDGIEPRSTRGRETFDYLAERLEAPPEPHRFLRSLAKDFGQWESRVFAREGRTSEHPRWPALKQETEARKGSSRILVQSGRLRASVVDQRHPDFFAVLRSKSVIFGTRTPYAPYANRRRPILRVTKEIVKRWSRAFADFVANRKH